MYSAQPIYKIKTSIYETFSPLPFLRDPDGDKAAIRALKQTHFLRAQAHQT